MSNKLNRGEYFIFTLIFVFTTWIVVFSTGADQLAMLITGVLVTIASLLMAVMRCTDIGCNKLLTLLLFVPLANIVIQFYFLFAPSKN